LYKGKDMEKHRDFIQRYFNFFDAIDEYLINNARIAFTVSKFYKGPAQK
jgi:hypothetical protein